MASLTQTAITTRKAIRYSVYAVIIFFIIRFAFNLSVGIYKRLNPAGPPPPTVGFARLPNILFPEQNNPVDQLTYNVETSTGDLPVLPEQAKVYLMPKTLATLNSFDDAQSKARSLGFDSDPIQLSDTLYRFTSSKAPTSMEINIVSGAFSVDYNLAADASPLQEPPPESNSATQLAKQLLTKANSLPEDLTGPVKQDFLRVDGQNLVSALSLADADLVRVSLFRHNMEKTDTFEGYPSLTGNPSEANVWILVSGASANEKKLIGAQYHYLPIDETKFETYPIKTAQQALDNLVAGGGYIASLGLNQENNITIRKIYLAYFDPSSGSQFYQPIIVFEGDNGFMAYVPAVSEEYYGE